MALAETPSSLLLLPALPLPSSPLSLRSAYKVSFETLLPRLIPPKGSQSVSRLDIAVVLSESFPITASRSAGFAALQTLLAQTYSLVCAVAARLGVELDFPGGLDVRIFLLEAPADDFTNRPRGNRSWSGPIVDCHTLVSANRAYGALYSVEGEVGEGHLKSLVTAWQSKDKLSPPPVHRLPRGPVVSRPGPTPASSEHDGPATAHKAVAVGGTFDHLHMGHKLLLTATVLLAEPRSPPPRTRALRQITVGITGDALLVNKKFGSVVESWDVRQERTAAFVESVLVFHPHIAQIKRTELIDEPGPNGKVVRVTYGEGKGEGEGGVDGADMVTINYTQISDPFGPTVTEEAISALIISGETRAGGKAVNDKRREQHWQELQVFEVDVLDASLGLREDDGSEDGAENQSFASKISSTEIRRRLQGLHASASTT